MSVIVDRRETDEPHLLLISEEEAKRSIVVYNIPPKIKAETVCIHFQRKKHGGGSIDRVHISREGTAVITFEKNEGVLYFSVLRHCCLCESGGKILPPSRAHFVLTSGFFAYG